MRIAFFQGGDGIGAGVLVPKAKADGWEDGEGREHHAKLHFLSEALGERERGGADARFFQRAADINRR